ncbi:MAG: hypothetical protein AB1611_13990 [bacterium]
MNDQVTPSIEHLKGPITRILNARRIVVGGGDILLADRGFCSWLASATSFIK